MKAPSRIFQKAFVDSLPVLMGYSTMGFAAGVLLAARGETPVAPFWGMLTAAAFVSGTLSFAIVPLMAASSSLASVALLTLAINFRYAFYGFSMLVRWKDVAFFKKLYLIHMLTDENYALETAFDARDSARYESYCLKLSMLNHLYWIFGCTAGAAAVYALERTLAPEEIKAATRGIEFAMVALFLVILTDQIRGMVGRGR